MTKQFVAAYQEEDGTIEFELFPDMPHRFGLTTGLESDRSIALMKMFVARCLSVEL